MATATRDVDTLNELIKVTLDSADGYAQAAREAHDAQFKSLFSSRAGERRELARRLQTEVRALGGEPEDDGSLMAAAHREFLNLRNVLGNGEKAIVDEVERGEDFIKEKYERALERKDLSYQARDAVLSGYNSVKSGHDQVRNLRDSGAAPR